MPNRYERKEIMQNSKKIVVKKVTATVVTAAMAFSMLPMNLVFAADATEPNAVVASAEDGSVKIAPGTYTVTANMYVEGKDNVVLDGVTAYLTNPNLPPLTPLQDNAKLVVDQDGKMTLTITNLNGIFALVNIEAGDNQGFTITNKITQPGSYGEYSERISGLVMDINDTNGHYEFKDCVQYPTILSEYKYMPVQMDIDFSSIRKGFDDSVEYTTKYFTDKETGTTAAIKTSDADLLAELSKAKFKVEKLTSGEDYDSAVETINKNYTTPSEYGVYKYSLVRADGTEISTTEGNTQVDYTVTNDYSYPKVYQVENASTRSINFSSNSEEKTISFSTMGLGTVAVLEQEGANLISCVSRSNGDFTGAYWYTANSPMWTIADVYALEPQTKETTNGTEYYFGFESMGNEFSSFYSNDRNRASKVYFTLPEKKDQYVYLVMDYGTRKTAEKISMENAVTENGKTTVDLFKYGYEDKTYAKSVLSALWNGRKGNEPTEKKPTAYILQTSQNLVSAPVSQNFTYNGEEQTSLTAASDKYTISGTTAAKNAGDYTATASLTDEAKAEGYTWADGTTEDKTYNWSIAKKKLYVQIKYGDTTAYSNIRLEPGTETYGDVEYVYNGFVNDETAETASGFVAPVVTLPELPCANGKYDITMEGGSADNYEISLRTKTVIIGLASKPYVSYSKYWDEYTGEEQTVRLNGSNINVGYDLTGTTKATDAGEYDICVKLKDGYTWEDGTTDDLNITWKIGKREVAISYKSQYDNTEYVYEGSKPKAGLSYDSWLSYQVKKDITQEADFVPATVKLPEKLEPGKSYTVTPEGFSAKNYEVTYIPGTIVVLPKLVNKSTISSTNITLGQKVTINAAAEGGFDTIMEKANYKYKFYCRSKGASGWTALTGTTTNPVLTKTLTRATTYEFAVKVADSNDKVVTKYFTVNVSDKLENVSVIDKTEITLGEKVTLTALGNGGKGEYKYKFYCRSVGASGWTALTSTTTNPTLTKKLARATTYEFAVKVADENNRVVTKFFTVKVNPKAE